MLGVASHIITYLDHHAINLLAKSHCGDERQLRDWQAMHHIWKVFQEGKIRLITSGDDTGIDIILCLNQQGCCVTDTMMAVEAIEDFEAWNKAEGNSWKSGNLCLSILNRLMFYQYFQVIMALARGLRNW